MLSHRNKYILYLASLSIILTIVFIVGGRTIFEQGRSLGAIGLAIPMFVLYEVFVIFFTESKGKTLSSRQSVNLFLGFKAGKILLSLLFIIIYAITVKVELKRFILVFILLYAIFLVFDTLYLMTREKDNKKKYKLKEIEKVSNYYKDAETKEYHFKEIEKLSNYYK